MVEKEKCMKNYEKYADEIREYEGKNFCGDFIEKYILKSNRCPDMNCTKCHMLQTMWLLDVSFMNQLR